MRLKLPRYVHGFIDRNGIARYYFRRHGKRTALPGLPWSPEFMAAYAAAEAQGPKHPAKTGIERTVPGSINALAVAYLNSAGFQNLAKGTQDTYRCLLDNFRIEHGNRSAVSLDRRAVSALVAQKANKPAAASNRLRIIRLLMRFAVVQGWRDDDPTTGVKPPKMRSGGFHTWTDDEIKAFEATHPMGSRARLAFALLLWTAQRRGDVVRMGRQNIQNDWLTIRQQKTGVTVQIPIHSELRTAIDSYPHKNLTLLVTDFGKPFSSAGFGNWFREMCREAGLPDNCAAHGLRKAAARRLAEAGCTAHQIMAITGHKTLREVTRYTDAADRHGLAATAMAKIESGTSSGKL
jgi:integrase